MLQEMYKTWPFFRVTKDLIEMVFAKGDPGIAALNDKLLISEDLWSFGEALRANYEETKNLVLKSLQMTCWWAENPNGDESEKIRQEISLIRVDSSLKVHGLSSIKIMDGLSHTIQPMLPDFMKQRISQSMVLPRQAANVPFRRTPVPKKPKAHDPNKRDMTYEEKQKLSSNLQNLPLDHLDGVVQIIKKTNTLKIKKRAEIQQARALAGNDTIQNPIVYVPDAPNEQTTDEQGPAPTSLNQGENRGDNASSSSSNSSSSDSDSDSSSEEGSPRVVFRECVYEVVVKAVVQSFVKMPTCEPSTTPLVDLHQATQAMAEHKPPSHQKSTLSQSMECSSRIHLRMDLCDANFYLNDEVNKNGAEMIEEEASAE
ncbi:phosphoenolpyruvate carboxylase [Tanacetum coccineum]